MYPLTTKLFGGKLPIEEREEKKRRRTRKEQASEREYLNISKTC